jgi:hypothetical protein
MTLKAAAVATAVLVPSGAWNSGAAKLPASRLTVCMAAPRAELATAQEMAGRMFAGIGVGITWQRDEAACPADAVAVTMLRDAPQSARKDALAEATLFGDQRIRVFYNRARARVTAEGVSCLLAHVLAHEITHIAQAIDRHSSVGLMKAHWPPSEIQEMCRWPLAFTAHDVDLIHRGLSTRTAHFEARALPVNAK